MLWLRDSNAARGTEDPQGGWQVEVQPQAVLPARLQADDASGAVRPGLAFSSMLPHCFFIAALCRKRLVICDSGSTGEQVPGGVRGTACLLGDNVCQR